MVAADSRLSLCGGGDASHQYKTFLYDKLLAFDQTGLWADIKRTLASKRGTGGGDLSALAKAPTTSSRIRPGAGAISLSGVVESAVLKCAVECRPSLKWVGLFYDPGQ